MIGVSACLAGIACRYDGQAKEIAKVKEWLESGKAMPVCPEVLGGLPIPREPAEIQGGNGEDVWSGKAKVITTSGEDVTASFKRGAEIAVHKLKEMKIDCILMKENSPSCGVETIYDGTFSGSKKNGLGVATAYFIANGIRVIPEEQWHQILNVEYTNGK